MNVHPPILSLTSEEFVHTAAAEGLRRPEALRRYRQVYRQGRDPGPPVTLSRFPMVRRAEEAGTIKFVLGLPDGLETESVIIPSRGSTGRARCTLCVSSQVGCALGCTFCETARMGLLRDLTAEEIVGQWFAARFALSRPIRNVVFMGMGEPMDNLDQVLRAIRVLTDHNGPAIAPARLSVSTVGRVDGIRRLAALAQEPGFRRLRLAVSINAPHDAVRSSIMPVNRAAPLASLLDAMREWPARDGSRILIGYVLIPEVNDSDADAAELCRYLKPLACVVNVIPYNPRRDSPWLAPREADVDRFIRRVADHGQRVIRRAPRGRSVMAACGQLGNERIRRRRGLLRGPDLPGLAFKSAPQAADDH